jgi:exonuclease SbcD
MKFIHTADIHFGMENYGRIDPKTGIHSRLLDFEKSLNTCIDYAIEQKVDFFLFAGDAYKTANPSPTQQKLLLNCFMKLYRAHIPVVIVVGNHDNPLSFGKAHALDIFKILPVEGFHVFSKPDILHLTTRSGPVQIVGIPWPNRHNISMKENFYARTALELTQHISDSLAQIIGDLAQKLDPALPAVLTGHLTVTSGIFSGSEKRAIYGHDPVLMPSQLAIEPFDYVGLGHLHRFQNANSNGKIPVIYSGSIDRIDFGERKEDKGFCLVTIHSKEKTEYEFIKLETRPFVQIEVSLERDKDQTATIIDAIKKHTITDAIVKILYTIPEQLVDEVNLRKVQTALIAAMHVVGVIPIRMAPTRTHRNILKQEMDLKTLLTEYFSTKEQFKNRTEILIEKALNLELEAQEKEIVDGL